MHSTMKWEYLNTLYIVFFVIFKEYLAIRYLEVELQSLLEFEVSQMNRITYT